MGLSLCDVDRPRFVGRSGGLNEARAVVRLGAEAETKQQGYIVVVILRE